MVREELITSAVSPLKSRAVSTTILTGIDFLPPRSIRRASTHRKEDCLSPGQESHTRRDRCLVSKSRPATGVARCGAGKLSISTTTTARPIWRISRLLATTSSSRTTETGLERLVHHGHSHGWRWLWHLLYRQGTFNFGCHTSHQKLIMCSDISFL
jgi:hypothetical protein